MILMMMLMMAICFPVVVEGKNIGTKVLECNMKTVMMLMMILNQDDDNDSNDDDDSTFFAILQSMMCSWHIFNCLVHCSQTLLPITLKAKIVTRSLVLSVL